MTDTNFRGPVNSMGSMEDSPATILPTDGPMGTYQGVAILNIRAGAFDKDGIGAARVPSYLDNPRIVTVDNIPSAATTTIIAAAAAVATGVAMTLTTIAPGNTTAGVPSIAPGLPIIPFGASAAVNVIALDFGFTTGTTVAGSSTIAVVDNTMFTSGQWLAIGGAGNAAKTASLLTQVQSIVSTNTTGITVLPAPAGSLTNAPIGAANQWNQFTPPSTQFGPATGTATAATNQLAGGLLRMFNPVGGIARNLCINPTLATAAGGAFKYVAYDVHNQLMTETITVPAGVTTATYGKKAIKFLLSVTPQFTDTVTYSVGVGDTFGFPLVAPRYEMVDWKFAGVNQINSTGFLAADFTSPALATSGDVRGTFQTSTKGAGTGLATNLASDGIRRLCLIQTLPLLNTVSGTPLNTVPIFGPNNSTT